MSVETFIKEAVRLAQESVENGWGGPFGAVIVSDGEIVSRGQNRVLLTGDITAHAEVEAIRKAVPVLNPYAPSISEKNQNEFTLRLIPRPEGSPDVVPERAQMLDGMEIYTSGAPCPMCMSAIYWARISGVYFSKDWEDTRAIGFDDAFQYEDFARPISERRIKIQQVHPEIGEQAYQAWMARENRHPY
jgi:tRNA(Arg) A34 adenosine deaminase TadA